MDHIAPILKGLLARANLQQGVSNYALFGRWNEVVGEHLAAVTRPLRIQGDLLWVYVENATLRHHMTFLVPQMLERIRRLVPDARITAVRFTLNPEWED